MENVNFWKEAREADKEPVFIIVDNQGKVAIITEDEVAEKVTEANGFNENDAASLHVLKRDGNDLVIVGKNNDQKAFYAALPKGSKVTGKPNEDLDSGWLFIGTNDDDSKWVTVVHNSDFSQAFCDEFGFDASDRRILKHPAWRFGEDDAFNHQWMVIRVQIPLRDGISKFEVRYEYMMSSQEIVYATSKDDAVQIAKQLPIPESGEYIEDTFAVTHCSLPNKELGDDEWENEMA